MGHANAVCVESAKVEEVTAAPVPSESGARPSRPTHCVVGGAHAFILRISSFFGLAPLRFESRSNGFTVVSTCDVLVVVATAGAGVYGAPRRMRNMLKFMENIASVDTSIGGQYSLVTERKLCGIILAILIFFSILIADDFTFYALQAKKLDREWDVVTNYLGFYLLWFVVLILELQFAFTALSVRARFSAVNDALALTARQVSIPVEKPKSSSPLNIYAIRGACRHHQENCNTWRNMTAILPSLVSLLSASGEPRLVVSPCDAVRRLAALHGTLCDVVNSIDDSYGLPLVVILISTLLHLIVTPYFLIMEISNCIHESHSLPGAAVPLVCDAYAADDRRRRTRTLYYSRGQKNRGASMSADDVSAVYRRAAFAPGDILAAAHAPVCELCAHGHVHAASTAYRFCNRSSDDVPGDPHTIPKIRQLKRL
ncbi:hypothetical protein B5X24_HaOG200851 [Helicoverpa armigera]|uniref:Gustatory receptor n=1 Tax=Helicoverpa armigera TaxID=29058 RepID=A0A2W1BGL0_HELAM|nr:hypothetical protein B5X24_HaOG200851 [Helicoverpa armigera]